MRYGKILHGSLAIFITTVFFLCTQVQAFGAIGVEPDWISAEPILLSRTTIYTPSALEQQVPCSEMKVFQLPLPWGGTVDRELCVMKGNTFRLAVDQNGNHMFVALGSSDYYSMVQKDSWSRFYVAPNTDSVVVFRKLPNIFRVKMMIQNNFPVHLSQLLNGEMVYDFADGEFPSNGTELIPSAWALSDNGRYLVYSYGITYGLNDRVVVVDLVGGGERVVGSLNYGSLYSSPAPLARLAISNDASLVLTGGPKWLKVWNTSGDCGVGLDEENLWDGVVRDYCDQTIISPLAYGAQLEPVYDDAVIYNISISHNADKVSFVQRRGVNDTTYTYARISLRAYNVVPPQGTQYLALGDSYSSGEGDVTSDGTTHYIPGTNVMGDYARNIPREMCHISDRSYPFLIAKQMSLGSDAMKSIACSGAVANDALTFDANDRLRIHADNYLGQGTQLGKFGGDGPRLTGIAGYEQLQQDALMQTLPGRVQQINHVEKTKPEAITVTMGGNDFGYGAIITSCMNVLNSPIKSDTTCWDAQPDGRQARAQQIHDFYPRLKHLYETLRLSTDSGNVFVIGYPRFFDESFICADMGNLITRTEQTSLNQLINYANATIKAAALDAGVKYIDISDVFDGSELCGRSTSMTSIKSLAFRGVMTEYAKWKQLSDDNIRKYGHIKGSFVNTNPIFMSTYLGVRGASIQYDGGSNPYGALTATAQQLVHPNSYGHTLIYDRIHDGLGDELLTSKSCNAIIHCSVLGNDGKPVVQLGAPSPADYIPGTTLSTNGTIYLTGDGAVSIGHIVDKSIVETGGVIARGASKVVISVAKEWLNAQQVELQAPPRLIIHSTPTDLGVMAYDAADDAYSLEVSISPTLDIGAHTLHVVGTTSTGRDIEIISHAFVMGLDGDIDADGISDEYDACVFGEPNGVDKDVDGISDNCDLGIDESKPVIPAPQADVEDNSIASVLGTSDDTDSGTFISGQRAAQGGGAALESILPNISKADGTSARRASNKDWGYLVLPALFILISVLMYAAHRRSIRH